MGEASSQDLKKKKDSLMVSSYNCLSKIKQSKRTGLARNDIYKPNWFAYETMARFLLDKDESREILNTETNSKGVEDDADNITDDVEIRILDEVETDSAGTFIYSQ